MKILLFGSKGQLGWELQRSLAPLGMVVALTRTSKRLCGDLTDIEGLRRTIDEVKPTVIVNAAAYTAVDQAEDEAGLCRKINTDAVQTISTSAKMAGALLIHYSTDYVYSGEGDRPWKETDPLQPLNVYGSSKMDGEKACAESGTSHIILRSSWIYSAKGNNFPKTILRLLKERKPLRIIDDQIGSPTSAEYIADVTSMLIKTHVERRSLSEVKEVFNLAAAGETSWFNYAKFIVETLEEFGEKTMNGPSSELTAISSEKYRQKAKRPLNSRLDTRKIKDHYNIYSPDWRVGVVRMMSEIGVIEINEETE